MKLYLMVKIFQVCLAVLFQLIDFSNDGELLVQELQRLLFPFSNHMFTLSIHFFLGYCVTFTAEIWKTMSSIVSSQCLIRSN